MQRIFVTHILPSDKILKYHLSVAACNFSFNLIEGNIFDKVFSILPTFVSGKIESFEGLVYSSWREKNILYKFAPFLENIRLFFKIPSKSSIWYYNCTILNAPLIILLKLLKPGVKQNMIILDYTPSSKVIDRFFLWLTNHMDGTIRLADSPLFTCKNSVCLPGVVPANSPVYPQVTDINNEFLISGALGENISMLTMLLHAFSQMPETTLHITGKAPNIDLIKEYTNKYRNIIYHGMVSYEEYLRILHRTPFLLSTRNPSYPENQCNFPSKIIEALLHNRIVISTLHYNQLEGINYFEVNDDCNDFMNDIQGIISMPKSELLQYANQSLEVMKRFNSNVWKAFMEQIEKNK